MSAFYRQVNQKLCSGHDSLLTADSRKAEAFNNYFILVFIWPTLHSNVETSFSSSIISNNINFAPNILYNALRKAKQTLSAGHAEIPSIF